jgi:hypothetical protein
MIDPSTIALTDLRSGVTARKNRQRPMIAKELAVQPAHQTAENRAMG